MFYMNDVSRRVINLVHKINGEDEAAATKEKGHSTVADGGAAAAPAATATIKVRSAALAPPPRARRRVRYARPCAGR